MCDPLGNDKHLAGLKRYVTHLCLPVNGRLVEKDQLVGVHVSVPELHRFLGPLGKIDTHTLRLINR